MKLVKQVNYSYIHLTRSLQVPKPAIGHSCTIWHGAGEHCGYLKLRDQDKRFRCASSLQRSDSGGHVLTGQIAPQQEASLTEGVRVRGKQVCVCVSVCLNLSFGRLGALTKPEDLKGFKYAAAETQHQESGTTRWQVKRSRDTLHLETSMSPQGLTEDVGLCQPLQRGGGGIAFVFLLSHRGAYGS